MKKHAKLLVFLAAVLLILLLDQHFGWSIYLGNWDNLSFLSQLAQENLWEAALIYSLITIIGCVVLALPGITFAVFAGLLFGPWLGTVICLIATTAGAALAFLAGRFFLQDSIKPLVEKNPLLKKLLFDDKERSHILILMITRLVPLFPYNLQNFAYGITNISFGTYTLCTFLFMLPGVALFTIGSAGLTAGSDRWLYFLIAAVLLVLVLVLAWFIKAKFLNIPAGKGDPQ